MSENKKFSYAGRNTVFVNYRITVNFKIVTLNISKILRQLFLLFASS